VKIENNKKFNDYYFLYNICKQETKYKQGGILIIKIKIGPRTSLYINLHFPLDYLTPNIMHLVI